MGIAIPKRRVFKIDSPPLVEGIDDDPLITLTGTFLRRNVDLIAFENNSEDDDDDDDVGALRSVEEVIVDERERDGTMRRSVKRSANVFAIPFPCLLARLNFNVLVGRYAPATVLFCLFFEGMNRDVDDVLEMEDVEEDEEAEEDFKFVRAGGVFFNLVLVVLLLTVFFRVGLTVEEDDLWLVVVLLRLWRLLLLLLPPVPVPVLLLLLLLLLLMMLPIFDGLSRSRVRG